MFKMFNRTGPHEKAPGQRMSETAQHFWLVGHYVWNSLPDVVTSACVMAVFRTTLKAHLFNISYRTVPVQ